MEKGVKKMGTKVKDFPDGTFLEYDEGKFDKWCVYMNESNGTRRPPSDIDYFAKLRNFAEKYGADRIYQDFVKIYDWVGNDVNVADLKRITHMAADYGNDALELDKIFSILYMAMIAEEKKEHTKLGKRIKRLGVHMLLMENETVQQAANFMRGMNWHDIDALCRKRGF